MPARTLAALTASIALAASASAHDFWLQAGEYQMETAGQTEVQLRIGHTGEFEAWNAQPDRIMSLRALSATGLADLQSGIGAAGPLDPVPVTLSAPGLNLVLVETTQAFSELEAEKFNSYVEEEGIHPIAADRIARATTDTPGTELYSRRSKALVQVGEALPTDDALATTPVGFTLEILPLANPYSLDAGADFNFEVRFRGAPVPGATVHIVSLDGTAEDRTVKTDAAGRASISRPESGAWMFHCVWAERSSNTVAEADYATVFSSLTFGF